MTEPSSASIIPDGQLWYGMQLQVQAQSGAFAEPWEASAGTEELTAMVKKADETGYAYVAVCDHVVVPKTGPSAHMSTTWYDTTTTLGYFAGFTKNVRLLSNVAILPYRHPLQTIKQWITLDRLSGGRAILGVGAGWIEAEFETLGVDFHRRGRLLDESIDVVRAGFLDEYPVHAGPNWTLDGTAGLGPRPIQRQIPIWIGGSGNVSKQPLRRVAERGDGWVPQGVARTELAAQIGFMEEHRKRVRPGVKIDYGYIGEPIYVGEPAWDVSNRPVLMGSGEKIAARLRELRGFGVNHVQLRFRNRSVDELLDQMDAFHQEVAPHLNA